MANTKISELSSSAGVSATDLTITVVGSPGSYVTRKATAEQLATYVTNTISNLNLSTLTASVISASTYVGIPAGDVAAAENNTFTGINTFNDNYITASSGITGSDAKFTLITASVISASTYVGIPIITGSGTATLPKVNKITGSILLDDTKNILLVDASGGDVDINLPAVQTNANQQYRIKRIDSSANDVNILGTLLSPVTYDAKTYSQKAVLSGSFALDEGDNFGNSLELNAAGNVAVIGAHYDENATTDHTGLAYIFRSSSVGWAEESVLSGSFAVDQYDRFGNVVTINASGDLVMVSANYDENAASSNTGLVYVFRSGSGGWYEEAILSGSLATEDGDWFGFPKLNSAGDIALISAISDESGSNGEPYAMGLVYVFRSSSVGWAEEAVLSGSFATGSYEYFGSDISLNSVGDIALISAIYDESGSNGEPLSMGLAYIFRSSSVGWTEEAVLSGSFATGSYDNFGASVTLNSAGNIALIGAPYDETGSAEADGLAYIFTSGTTGWTETAILTHSLDVLSGDGYYDFGGFWWKTVMLNAAGDIAVVAAAAGETNPAPEQEEMGVIFVYASGTNGWQQTKMLTGSFATGSYEYFGNCISLNASGNILLVGAFEDEATTSGLPNAMGVAYVFESELAREPIDGANSITIDDQYASIDLVNDGTGSWFVF